MASGGSGRRLCRIGIRDTYAHGASRPYLMREYGIDARALVDAVELLLRQRFDISPDDLDQVDLPAPGRGSRLEDL